MFVYFLTIPHIRAVLLAISIILILEVVLRFYRTSVTREYKSKKPEILSGEDAERESLRYFSKLHIISIVRVVYFFIVVALFIALYDIRAFSFFAVAFGAIIIALRDVIISLLAYPFVLINYDIGDDVHISGVLGEIVRVNTFSTHLAGKDERGDHNGKLHIIPNSRFLIEPTEKQEIKNGTYRKVCLQAFYDNRDFEKSFTEWLPELKTRLDTILSKRSMKEVGNFKSYAGIRYKLHYDYGEKGHMIVSISFIARIKSAAEKKEEIVSYIESTKRVITGVFDENFLEKTEY